MAPAPFQDDSDESLMRRIQKGSHQAFSILVRRHADRFHAAAFRMCGRLSEAEDMVQDAFLKIWDKPDLWKDDRGAKFTTWFYRILVNQNIDRMRKHKNMAADNFFLDSMPDPALSPEASAAQAQEQGRIDAAISTLPERQRTALNLCYYEGLSNAEAAAVMGVRVKALESLLMRAKAGLKESMSRSIEEQKKGERHARR